MAEDRDKDDEDPSDEGADESSREEDEEPSRDEKRSASSDDDDGSGLVTLGLQRWVQFAFVGIAIVTFFVTDKLITLVWDYFAEPIPLVASAVGAVVGMVTGFALYRTPKMKTLADEVAGELAKVTWPSRKETWYSSIVVIVTSIIAAIYVGLFDAAWSAVTDYIYSLS